MIFFSYLLHDSILSEIISALDQLPPDHAIGALAEDNLRKVDAAGQLIVGLEAADEDDVFVGAGDIDRQVQGWHLHVGEVINFGKLRSSGETEAFCKKERFRIKDSVLRDFCKPSM